MVRNNNYVYDYFFIVLFQLREFVSLTFNNINIQHEVSLIHFPSNSGPNKQACEITRL